MDSEQQWDEDMLSVRWEAQEDDLIGGYCVMPEGSSSPADGGMEFASMMTQGLAEHVAELHNAWLEQQPRT